MSSNYKGDRLDILNIICLCSDVTCLNDIRNTTARTSGFGRCPCRNTRSCVGFNACSVLLDGTKDLYLDELNMRCKRSSSDNCSWTKTSYLSSAGNQTLLFVSIREQASAAIMTHSGNNDQTYAYLGGRPLPLFGAGTCTFVSADC